ncbi:MAG: AI-2E family transporter [Thermoleophilia bacterium]|jgi:predicted PurR-regulated permease PerM
MSIKKLNIIIPRWIQVVGLPVIILFLWFTASLITQVLFIFASAAILSLILDPLVRQLERVRVPRFIGVFVVYLALIAIIVLLLILLIPPAISQLQNLVNNMPGYTDTVKEQVNNWISRLEGLNLPINVSDEARKMTDRFEGALVHLGSLLLEYSINFVSALTQIVVVLIISIYMLIDSKRIGRFIRNFFPGDQQEDADEFVQRSQSAVNHWVRGQALLCMLIGISSGIGIWFLGVIGVWPEGAQYSVFFGAWAGVTEFIPYLGPILGAIPPVVVAMFASPWAALAVVLVFIFIQQVEGHILVPNIMGSVVGVHPLVVIFATLAGAEIMGIPGMFLALPLVALTREVVAFFKPRISLQKWQMADEAEFKNEIVTQVEGERPSGNE